MARPAFLAADGTVFDTAAEADAHDATHARLKAKPLAAWIAGQERLQDYDEEDAVDWAVSILGDQDGFRKVLTGMGFKLVKRSPKAAATEPATPPAAPPKAEKGPARRVPRMDGAQP